LKTDKFININGFNFYMSRPPPTKAKGCLTKVIWFPDGPTRELPPNKRVRIARVRVKNCGAEFGIIRTHLFRAIIGKEGWKQRDWNNSWLKVGAEEEFDLYDYYTPSHGQVHYCIKVLVWGTEKEPPFPPIDECPSF